MVLLVRVWYWVLEFSYLACYAVASNTSALPYREYFWGAVIAIILAIIQLSTFRARPLRIRLGRVIEIGLFTASAYVTGTHLLVGLILVGAGLFVEAAIQVAYRRIRVGKRLRVKVAKWFACHPELADADTRLTVYTPKFTCLGRRLVAMFPYCHSDGRDPSRFGIRRIRPGSGVVGQCAKKQAEQAEDLSGKSEEERKEYFKDEARFRWYERRRLSSDREAYWAHPVKRDSLVQAVVYVDTNSVEILSTSETREVFDDVLLSIVDYLDGAKEASDAS